MLDLREGNFRWKKLPALSALEGHSVLRCASFDNGGCCTTYHIVWTKTRNNTEYENEEGSCVWTLNTRNDKTESQSQWKPEMGAASSHYIIHKSIEVFAGLGEEAPLYLSFNIPSDTGADSPSALYKLCAARHYNTDYTEYFEMPDFLLMQYHGEAGSILYYIRSSFEGIGFRKVNFYKVQLNHQNSKRLKDEHESEWHEFCDTWIHSLTHGEQITATKVLCNAFPGWEMSTFNINEVVDTESIKLAPRGPLYVYYFKANVL